MLSEVEPSQLKTAEEEQIRDDNFSFHSVGSSSWSLVGRLHQEERTDVNDDADVKVCFTLNSSVTVRLFLP